MTRQDQINAVAFASDISAVQARKAIDAMGALVKLGLLEDERFSMTGVGTFTVSRRGPRRVTNPHTGVMMDLPAKAVVRFKPSPDLRASVEERHS